MTVEYKIELLNKVKIAILDCRPLPTHFIIKDIKDSILDKLWTFCESTLVVEFIGNDYGTRSMSVAYDLGFPHYILLPIECICNSHLDDKETT